MTRDQMPHHASHAGAGRSERDTDEKVAHARTFLALAFLAAAVALAAAGLAGVFGSWWIGGAVLLAVVALGIRVLVR